MKNWKNAIMVQVVVALVFFATGCGKRETVKGKISNKIVTTKSGEWTIREGIEREDKIFILDFSAKTRFDQNMKSLPYPKKNGFYEIPEGSKGANALQMENGDIIYFQKDKEYEVTGTLGELAEIDLLPHKQADKQYSLLSVKKIKMLESNNSIP